MLYGDGETGNAASIRFLGDSDLNGITAPGSWQYKAMKDKLNDLLDKQVGEQVALAALDPKKNASQIEERKKRLEDLGAEIAKLDEEIKQHVEKADSAIASEVERIDKHFEPREKAREDRLRLGEAMGRDKENKRDAKEELDNWKKYNSLLKQRSDLYKTMMADQRRSDLSIHGNEKEQIALANKERAVSVGLIEEEMAKMRESNMISEKEVEKLEKKYAQIDKINEAGINTKNKGSMNLWSSLQAQIKGLFYNFTQMGMVYRILGKIRQSLSKVIQLVGQLDKAEANLRIVTGATRQEADNMMKSYSDLAYTLASTTTEVATAAQEWLRQGYEVSQVNDLVTASIKLSTLGMMSAADATKSLTSAMKGFKIESSSIDTIVDKFTSLDMAAATTAGDIATALSKFATTAQMAGLNIDQASAMATTIMDVSQSDAGATGNAIKTILSRFGNVKAGAFTNLTDEDSSETTEKINDIERVLSAIGVTVRSSAREMRDFDDVLADIAEKWGYLDKVSQNAIATALAGTRQREAFAVLMNNYDKYQELLQVAETSAGTADEKYSSYLDHLEASQKRLQTAWEDLTQNSDLNEFMTNWNNFLAEVVKKLPLIIKYVARLFTLMNAYKLPTIFGNVFGTGGLGITSLLDKAQNGLKENSFKHGRATQNKRIEDYLSEQESSDGLLSKVLEKTGLAGGFEKVTSSANDAAASLNKLSEATKKQSKSSKELRKKKYNFMY